METLEQIKLLVETLTNETTKFYSNSNSAAGTRARKAAQELKGLMHTLRGEILEHSKKEK